MKTIRAILLLLAASGCGNVSSPDHPGEPVMRIRAKLSATPPSDVDPGKLRGTLVWTNGLGLEAAVTLDCDATSPEGMQECGRELRGQVQVSTSDVQIAMGFPLEVKIDMYELPTPNRGKFEPEPGHTGSLEAGIYYSVPEAEVVVYEDRNGNGRLDLLPLGKAGPGPDRVVALSSGRDSEGVARRTVIAYKAGRIMPWGPYMPLLPEAIHEEDPVTHEDRITFDGPNGVFALRYKARKGALIEEEALLKNDALADISSLAWVHENTFDSIRPLADTTIALYPVDPERRSWLARGCERLRADPFVVDPNFKPPAGTDVQCGAGALAFSSHPDDYCGQVQMLGEPLLVHHTGAVPSWWPCDESGLKSGAPYRAATRRLDPEPLDGERQFALSPPHGDSGEFDRCQPGVFYHFEYYSPFAVPRIAPPAGSQVMCRSGDSLAYVPAPVNGCQYKFEYDLAFEPPAEAGEWARGWDLRSAPPSWWPCDANGQLRAGTPYVEPQEGPSVTCETQVQRIQAAYQINLRPGTAVRCTSAVELVYRRDWHGPCESAEQRAASSYHDDTRSWGTTAPPAWWPCDDEGKLRPDSPFVAF